MRRLTWIIAILALAGCQGDKKTEGDPDTSTDTGPADTAELEPSYGECVTDDDCEQPEGCGEAYCDLHSLLCMMRVVDADGDGYPAMEVDGEVCEGGTDCDDTSAAVHPGLSEVGCDMVDQDCDGVLDVTDDDGDGSYDPICGGDDCDDEDPAVYPGAAELCDVVDQDCDGDLLDAEGADDDTDGVLDEECGGHDCDDANPLVNPSSPEICDGVDNNCDGMVDSATGLNPGVRVSSTSGTGYTFGYPTIASSGSEHGVAWIDQRLGPTDVFFRRVSGSGAMASTEILVTEGGAQASRPRIEWTGSAYGMVWEDTRLGPGDVYFALVAGDGTVLASQERITTDFAASRYPDLEWTGSQFGVVWVDARDTTHAEELWFVRLAADGTRLGSDLMVTTGATGSWGMVPGLAWTGSSYGVAWKDERSAGSLYFALVDAGGSLLHEEQIASGSVDMGEERAAIAWSGSEFGVLWHQYSIPEAYRFARISEDGAVLGSALDVLETVGFPIGASGTLSWTGSGYNALLVGMDESLGWSELYMARIPGAGDHVEGPTFLPFSSGSSVPELRFDASWDAPGFALVSPQYDEPTAYNQIFMYTLADCD